MMRLWMLVVIVAIAPLAVAQTPPDHQTWRSRPIALGVSGGNVDDRSRRFCCGGTLGSLVQDRNSVRYILSNNHVISIHNLGIPGANIAQPGLMDLECVPSEADTVATLTTFVPLQYKPKGVRWRNAPTNTADAAIAAVVDGAVQTDGSILAIGPPDSTTVEPYVGMAVKKSGRTTGLTNGTVDAVDLTIIMRYSQTCGQRPRLKAMFTNQIAIVPVSFGASGDSGSLIVEDVDTCPHPVGLLVGGNRRGAVANRMDDVLSALNVSMVGCGPAPLANPAVAPRDATPKIPGVARESIQKAQRAKRAHEMALFQLPGVVGTGLSRSETDPTQPAVHIYVEHDTPRVRAALPSTLDGVPVKIIEAGKYIAR